MPYPHHPQHQHHQKSNSPSQSRRSMTPLDYDDSSSSSNGGSMRCMNGMNTSVSTGLDAKQPEDGHLIGLQRSSAEQISPLSSSSLPMAISENVRLSSSSPAATNMLTPLGEPASSSSSSSSTSSSSNFTSTPTSDTLSSLQGPTPCTSQPGGGPKFVSACPPSEDVEMMPLDLSFRGPQRTEYNLRPGFSNSLPSDVPPQAGMVGSGSGLKTSGPSQGYSRSHRLSPYHLFTVGLARSPGSTYPPLSRSPHSRSNSPFYQVPRQTPSPYCSYISPHGNSYYSSAENSSSFQVISTTNRVLNGLSSSSGVFRPYEDHMIQPETTPPPPPTEETNRPSQEQEDNEEEPTYYDLDSAAQKQAIDDSSFGNNDSCRSASLYNHQFPRGAGSINPAQYQDTNASRYVSAASVHDRSLLAYSSPTSTSSTSSSSSSSSSYSSISTSSPSSSTPPALLPQLPFISREVSEEAHCDLTHQQRVGGQGSGNNKSYFPYPNADETIEKSNHHPMATMPHQKAQLTIGSNNTNPDMVIPRADFTDYRQQHHQPDPDSSSSLSTSGLSPSSSESPDGHTTLSSSSSIDPPASTLRSESSMGSGLGLQPYPPAPECDGSVTSSGTVTSNKENLRDIQFRPQSFFRAPDKDFMEQSCRILAEKHRNEGANRTSLLDFWISKIRIAAAQSRKSNICQNRSKIKIRMVELMELQVEQSLRCDWR